MITLLVLLLVGACAVAAFAQDDQTPVQSREQVKERALNFIDEDGDGFCDLMSGEGAAGDAAQVRDRECDGTLTRAGELALETRELGPGQPGPFEETGFGSPNDREDGSETAEPARSRGASRR